MRWACDMDLVSVTRGAPFEQAAHRRQDRLGDQGVPGRSEMGVHSPEEFGLASVEGVPEEPAARQQRRALALRTSRSGFSTADRDRPHRDSAPPHRHTLRQATCRPDTPREQHENGRQAVPLRQSIDVFAHIGGHLPSRRCEFALQIHRWKSPCAQAGAHEQGPAAVLEQHEKVRPALHEIVHGICERVHELRLRNITRQTESMLIRCRPHGKLIATRFFDVVADEKKHDNGVVATPDRARA